MQRNALGRDAAENELLESFKPPQTLHLDIFFFFPAAICQSARFRRGKGKKEQERNKNGRFGE